MKKRLIILLSVALLLAQSIGIYESVTVSAATEPPKECPEGFYSDNDILTYNACATAVCTQGGNNATPGGAVDLSNVPDPWRSLIMQTAPLYPEADARLVAATLWAENRGWPDYNKNWGVSPVGAAGPWQFMPATWASMGTDGDGDGIKDRNNPKDAVHAAFKHQIGSTGKPIIEGFNGDLQAGLGLIFRRTGNPSLLAFMAKYNGRGAPENTTLAAFPRGQNSDYVIMGYYLLASNFAKGWHPGTGQVVDAAATAAPQTGVTPTNGAVANCNSATGSIDPNGYSFPIGLKKSEVSNGYRWPCEGTCHHDGSPAFDLAHKDTVSGGTAKDSATVGKPIFAITTGKVRGLRNNYKGVVGCFSFQLVGDDGYQYWHGHIANVSVQEGQTVSVGDKIAEVGPRACTGNGSYPHLHIDRGFPKGHIGGIDSSRDKDFIPLINELYEGLANE